MVYSIQVKRLRNEDPLDALIYSGAKRKAREEDIDIPSDSRFVFRLARTSDSQLPGNNVVLQGAADASDNEVRKFRLTGSKRARKNDVPSTDRKESDEIPAELQSMIEEYMNPQKKDSVKADVDDADQETEDYVYDVYFSEQAGPLAGTRVGYIDIDESEEKLLFGGSDSDDGDSWLGDDEDSNAEDYYKNEYPDEEGEDYDGSDVGSLLEDLHLGNETWSEDDAEPASAQYERYGWTK